MFGEAREGVQILVHVLAAIRLKVDGLQQEREATKGELGVLVECEYVGKLNLYLQTSFKGQS